MEFSLPNAIQVLDRTPMVIRALLGNITSDWSAQNEGGESWSPFDIVGHLIDGERTDWIPRARMILDGETRPFDPFNRTTHLGLNKGRTLAELLDTFERLRTHNLETLQGFNLTRIELDLPGTHPTLGPVTLRQLLASWVVHDLGHIAQISRTMAYQYAEAVGPWKEYLPVLGIRR